MDEYLKSTEAIECDHPSIRVKARELVGNVASQRASALRLFRFVRDRIPYNLFMISMHPDDFRATFVLEAGKGYCVQKAVLLCALARAVGIPSRLALARIRNHRIPPALQARLGRNEFPGHGYNQFFLEGRWISAAATFDASLCNQINVPVVEFNGREDALLPAQTLEGKHTSNTSSITATLPTCRWILSPSALQKSGAGISGHGNGLRMTRVSLEASIGLKTEKVPSAGARPT